MMDFLSEFNIKDKVLILTGGLGFLGMNYAKFLRKAGANVIVWDYLQKEVFEERVAELQKEDVGIEGVFTDITDEKSVVSAIQNTLNKFGRVDVLINNAAMNPAVGSKESEKQFVPLEEYPLDLWKKEMEVNLTGMFVCTKAVVPVMKKQGGGVIVNVASEVSTIAHDHRVYNEPGKYKSPAYVASKTGVVGLTRASAAQLGQYNIRVNAFSPGGVRNEKMPAEFVKRFADSNMLGRMAKADEYNAILLFLCSDASSFMTGANLVADGGKSSW